MAARCAYRRASALRVIRQYSLTGPCGSEGYLICVGRETASRGGSRYIHETLRPGQTLLISAPRNLFALQKAERVLLLAAGIGITPLYAMALQLEAAGTPFTLHYYVKHAESAAFARELAQLKHGECVIHTTSPRTLLAEHIPVATAGLHAWVCGPAGFMEKVREVATAKGWDGATIHSEAFQPAAPDTGAESGGSSRLNWPPPESAGLCPQIKPLPGATGKRCGRTALLRDGDLRCVSDTGD